ncbi:hypothetical protein L1285_20050 [Pseudoalteromonas sp. DL2-H2.2]|uniref:hypothetical protein n=1 Tax=Pseudoalteromonas sp. DL2-H2.2 TaxID=2908889 RepID=UPI001F40E464|nr:hypothetical protein [Pseudoalteromonas sp. DL2-H2.2]MCF2910603.1 hypothetical protein [Pseudoalteromonas sp. DL2-H2.2]
MFLLPLTPLICDSALVASDIVTDTEPPSYHAVGAITGNDKVGLNCLPAPGMATSLCQSAQLPLVLPKAQCLSPRVSVQSDIDYRNAGSALFAPLSDFYVVIQWRDSRCCLSKEAVQMLHPDTTTPLAEQQASRYGCPDGPQDVATGIARVLQAHPVN